MNPSLLAFGIGTGELILILAVVGGGLLVVGLCVFAVVSASQKPRPPALPPSTTEQRLNELNDLHAKKLVTEQEYQERRTAILKGL